MFPLLHAWKTWKYMVYAIIRHRFAIINRIFKFLKITLHETSAIFTDNPLISFKRNKNMRDNLVRSALRQNLPVPAAREPFLARARYYTCSFLNSATSISRPKSNFVFGTILHAPPPTSFAAFLAVNVVNFTC